MSVPSLDKDSLGYKDAQFQIPRFLRILPIFSLLLALRCLSVPLSSQHHQSPVSPSSLNAAPRKLMICFVTRQLPSLARSTAPLGARPHEGARRGDTTEIIRLSYTDIAALALMRRPRVADDGVLVAGLGVRVVANCEHPVVKVVNAVQAWGVVVDACDSACHPSAQRTS